MYVNEIKKSFFFFIIKLHLLWESCVASAMKYFHCSWSKKTLKWFINITYIGIKMTTIIFKQMLISLSIADSAGFKWTIILYMCAFGVLLSNQPLFPQLDWWFLCVPLWLLCAQHAPVGSREVGGFQTEPTSMANWSAHLRTVGFTGSQADVIKGV